MDDISREELEELKRNSEPDESVSIPQYEGMTADEAVAIIKLLSKKIGRMTQEEKNQYEVAQRIVDNEGILIDEMNEEDCARKRE